MMITIDNIAKRYGILPSLVLADATSFDLTVMHTATQWENYRHEQERAKHTGKGMATPAPDRDTMQAMLKAAKNLGQ